MNWLLEQTWTIGLAGAVLALMLAGGWIQTGRRVLLIVGILAVALTVALLAISVSVTTPREHVRQTLFEIAQAVESNETQQLLAYVSEQRPDVRDRAAREMPLYRFEMVKITNIHEITVDTQTSPPTAEAKFNIVVTGGTKNGMITGQRHPFYVELLLLREGPQWKVASYRYDDPTYSLRQ